MPDNRDAQLSSDWQGVGDMVEMGVRQQEMGATCDGGFVLVFGQDRVAGEPRVDQQNLTANFNAE